jgi:hypothetical protein
LGGTLATMSDERSDDGPSDPPLTKRASKLPAEDGATEENPEHSALVAEIVARDKSLLDRLAES